MNWLKRLKNENGPDTDTPKPTKPGFGGFGVPIPGHIENSMMAAVVIVPVPDWAADPANDAAAGLTVARVATVAVANLPDSKPESTPAEAIEAVPTTAPDPDRWAWPHSSAMNGAEIGRFTGRLALFVAKGLTSTEADALADKLVTRDRDGDDQRVCLECSHLSGWAGRRQCRGLQYAGMGGPLASAGQVAMLQRCNGFKGAAA